MAGEGPEMAELLLARKLARVSSLGATVGDGSPVDQVPPLPSTLAIAVMVFQLRVVTGTPKSRSNVPR